MNTRTVIFGIWLAAGCGPGSDGSTEAGSSGGATGTDGATSTTGGTTVTTGMTTGGATGTSGDTTATPTTDATTTGTTGTTTGGSTGGACEIAGEVDCAKLVAFSGELTMEECEACQGAPCGAVPECSNYPCVDGSVVIRGCCEDSECADLTPFCGMFIAVNNVCVESDDI